jgi:di/tricarboxylate transporter
LEGVNTKGAYICIAILAIAFVLFFTEKLPLAITAMLVPIALSFPGIAILSGKNAFKNFGEQWVVTFMAIFIVGEAIFKTGLANKLGDMVIMVAGTSRDASLFTWLRFWASSRRSLQFRHHGVVLRPYWWVLPDLPN